MKAKTKITMPPACGRADSPERKVGSSVKSLNCELILSKLAFHFFVFIHFLFKGFRTMTDRAAKLLSPSFCLLCPY
jgi:hypothetical protein